MRRAVFLDRDGVLNRVVMRGGAACSPRTLGEFELLEGAAEALARLKAAGFLLVVVTNQPDIARGKMPAAELDAMTALLRERLPVDEVRVCPHDDAASCRCRKPLAGMLLDAASDHQIDLPSSYLIGDSWKDLAAARAAGCTGILLDTGYNKESACDRRVTDLRAAVDFILGSS